MVDIIYPCHYVINPHGLPGMKQRTGQDEEVQSVVWADIQARHIYRNALGAIRDGATALAFECYAGRHRSVAICEMVASGLRDLGYKVRINHLSLGVSYEAR